MTILLQKFSVQDTGADDAKKISLYEKLARKGRLVVAVDVRGIGETQPPHHPTNDRSGPYSHLFNAETTMTFMTSYMDESLFGMRAQDVVRAVAYALSRPDSMKMGVRAVGKGAGARWVLYAAALDPRISSVVAERGLLSYRSVAQVDRYIHGAGTFLRDVLLRFDLPQVAATVADRKLTLLSPVDAMKLPSSLSHAREVYRWTAEAYRNAGAGDRFRIERHASETDPASVYFA